MGNSTATLQWLPTTFTLTFSVAAITAYYILGKKWRAMESNVKELEASLKSSVEKCAAERQGRIRAQQELRKALLQQKADNMYPTSYPMIPIGTVQSCFSTRNGTPRQPLLVPLARACLMFDPMRVPPASLEGEGATAKRRQKIYATRTPHRPCPIGLTVAKIEAVQGHMILLSGVDLVDGTPVLDVKPYLPYCDSIQDSMVPEWVKEDSLLAVASVIFSEGFHSALADCWESVKRSSLYSSPSEIKKLIELVLSWDIRSSSQRHQPHKSLPTS